MLNPHVHQSHFAPSCLLSAFPLHSNFIHGNNHAPFSGHPRTTFKVLKKTPNNKNVSRRLAGTNNIKAISTFLEPYVYAASDTNTDTITATVTVTQPLSFRSTLRDEFVDATGKAILLELVSAEDDPLLGFKDDNSKKVVNFTCKSWIQPKQERRFFTDKSYLPSQTPSGLTRLRTAELEDLQGDGEGERKTGDRVYDYDVYNDLGNPDESEDLKRPVLGGKELPYPRRCRTGRPPCNSDPSLESKGSGSFYVPRDEEFGSLKQEIYTKGKIFGLLFHNFWPSVESWFESYDGFPFFSDIGKLFGEGTHLPSIGDQEFWITHFHKIFRAIIEKTDALWHFEMPKTMLRDEFFWLRDEEFARQTLAGLNPLSIKLVKEWPLKSELDPHIYGPPESAITTELVEREINGIMTFDEALHQKKLFIIDYHDMLLPYVSKVRKIEGTTLYGSRALFFFAPDGTLKPLAIELVHPPMDGKPQWKQAFTPSRQSTSCWLWRLAKAHFVAHDAGYHQLVSHWLRTHCAAEPYVIATNRRLSVMHPIYRLLHPHLRYTMEINAQARQSLVSAGGFIEGLFSPNKYSLEISAVAYDQQWRFDCEALPKDLIMRGLAEDDKTAPHGLKLTIEDYPYANDGLLIWDALKQWVSVYVNHYYPDSSFIESDTEIQEWWTEIRTVGHGDKKDEPWWPELKTPEDLIEIITTMVWVTSGHHAAVNFGQYVYGGYFPNRPTIARINMPNEDLSNGEWKDFLERPEAHLLKTFPKQSQATKVMALLDVLSCHSPDEEYLGRSMEASWEEDDVIAAAFKKFSQRIEQIEGIIDKRNADKNLNNRCGAGVLPYELLKPFSNPGVTGKGVPNSITI
ncbi:hypothetical protein HS088_TW04G00736 [Tripterygium wilfordii]|uniref:Lipoxygenase n=1 Tax=Tripterygium wilfordii TaxID=458696 RepID=A0A7J7DQY2_TRIWF|nr:hypothetical protein HS088_TW04G00736 [Tripterygium wilfordii]